VIGGCKGSTGPSSVNPQTGKPYALDFPMITIADMVNAQRRLVDHLGIEKLLTVVGGSMGGMQVLQWVAAYPERVRSVIPIATALKNSPQQIAFNEVVRQSIMADPAWRQGDYYDYGQPEKGLAVARMIGHITFMSDQSMEEKFSRRLKNGNYGFKFGLDFEVEGYLRNRGDNFVKRFDANSYLYVTKAMDYFDLSDGKMIPKGVEPATRFLVVSFKSDWLYPSYQSQEIVRQLKTRQADVTYCEVSSTYGHDAFLLEVEEQTALIRPFLDKTFHGYKVVNPYVI
jgi:homoserine O-acetyltransferase